MSKEPAEIFERAAEDGFISQLKHHSTVSQFGQLNGALQLDGSAMREHFKNILHNQVGSLTAISNVFYVERLCRFSTANFAKSSARLKRTWKKKVMPTH